MRGRHRGVRRFSSIELIEVLEQQQAAGETGTIAPGLTHADLGILDPLSYLPFSQTGGALLLHLLRKRHERNSVITATNSSFSEWSTVFTNAKMTTALLDRITHHCHILETAKGRYRFKHRRMTLPQEAKIQKPAPRCATIWCIKPG